MCQKEQWILNHEWRPLAKTKKSEHQRLSPKESKPKGWSPNARLDSHRRGTSGAAESSPTHVGHSVGRVWVRLTECLWHTVCWVTRSASASWLRRIAVHVRVQPIHGHCNVIPHGDDQNHATIQSLSHCFHASLLREGVAVTKRSLLGCAKGIRLDVVIATDGIVWVVDFFAILHIELLNAGQLTGWRMESGDNLERHLGVDLELRAWTVEVPVAHTECVNVAAVTVCGSNETITILGTALLILHAHIETLLGGWVWCECCGNLVGLPQVHLCAACTHVASSTVVVRISLVWDPALAVALANIKGDLLLKHAEQLVLLVILHEVRAGANVDRVWALGHKANVNAVAILLDAICALPVLL